MSFAPRPELKRPPATPSPSTVRPEIQALRAVAVLGVLVYHLWPFRLQGGFVGVDVFFVVSGFLITDHLLREYERTGEIAVARFWARRARRLLPASLLVLAVTAVAVWQWVPEARWAQFGREIIASGFYVENWALAVQSVDYMALSNVKSPVQHFWSLGVEEQFYLVWPVAIISAAAVASYVGRRRAAGVAVLLSSVVVASLAYSIILTALDPSVAYFSTFTRAWEFGLGALLALVLRRRPAPFRTGWAAAASWTGFAAIAVAMLAFSERTPFPSFTALLPVLGTCLVIASGSPRIATAPTAIFSARPVQVVGDYSYGAYLWHWPIIILLPYVTGQPISTPLAVSVLVVSIMLGGLSKRFVEDPIREVRVLTAAPPRRSFVAVLIGMTLVTAIALPLAVHRIQAPSAPDPFSQPPCFGAAAMRDPACGPPEEVTLVASVASFSVDLPPDDIRACEQSANSPTFTRCDFGVAADGGVHVAIIGDSHSTRLVEPLRAVVEDAGGVLSTFLVSGCSMMSRELTGSAWGFDPAYAERCQRLTIDVHDTVASDPDIDVVILNNRTRLYVSEDASFRPLDEQEVAESIRRLQATGKSVVVIKDPPETNATPPQQAESAADCLERAGVAVCSLARAETEFADPMVRAASATGARVVDLSDRFCAARRCLWQIGGLVVYSDDNHLSRSFALSLTSALRDALRPSLRD